VKQQTITDALKDAIRKSGLAYIAIERATGVSRVSLMRFLRGEQSLRLDKADALAALFGLTLRPAGKDR
jgi:transcriptional regulator with XRE-family HTH domain